MARTQVLVLSVAACCFLAYTTALLPYPLNTIKLRLYSKNLSYTEFPVENASQIVPLLNLSNKTLLHCHGYLLSPDYPDEAQYIQDNILGLPFNVMAADYRLVTLNTYPNAALLAGAVAKVIGQAIEDMVAAGMHSNLLVLSGFSLGSEIAGDVARNLSFVLPQLFVMDPAGPLYDNNNLLTSVSASDAACVQCVHTDAGYYGSTTACGHQDYYPNGGVRYAPGCPIAGGLTDPVGTCSHFRAENYGGQAAKYPNAFLSIQCNSWDDFKAGTCNQNNIVPMGILAPCSAVGSFYLQTNYQSLYGLGQAGLTYNSTLANIH